MQEFNKIQKAHSSKKMEDKKQDDKNVSCYECGKSGHYKTNFLNLIKHKNKQDFNKKREKAPKVVENNIQHGKKSMMNTLPRQLEVHMATGFLIYD